MIRVPGGDVLLDFAAVEAVSSERLPEGPDVVQRMPEAPPSPLLTWSVRTKKEAGQPARRAGSSGGGWLQTRPRE